MVVTPCCEAFPEFLGGAPGRRRALQLTDPEGRWWPPVPPPRPGRGPQIRVSPSAFLIGRQSGLERAGLRARGCTNPAAGLVRKGLLPGIDLSRGATRWLQVGAGAISRVRCFQNPLAMLLISLLRREAQAPGLNAERRGGGARWGALGEGWWEGGGPVSKALPPHPADNAASCKDARGPSGDRGRRKGDAVAWPRTGPVSPRFLRAWW